VLEPLKGLKLLLDLNLENNPLSDWNQVFAAVTDKKDILVLNLKSAPIMGIHKTYEDCVSKASQIAIAALPGQCEIALKKVEEFKRLLSCLEGEVFYRSKRTYLKLKQHFAQTDQKLSASYVSNGSSSYNKGLSPLQNLTIQAQPNI
jgi:hypothetical protein